jgi:hypothetical protein
VQKIKPETPFESCELNYENDEPVGFGQLATDKGCYDTIDVCERTLTAVKRHEKVEFKETQALPQKMPRYDML